jgi:hypothetical protein
MWRLASTLAVLLTAGLASMAAGQTPDAQPRIELGGHISLFKGDPEQRTGGPRVTVNMTHRTALEAAVDWQLGQGPSRVDRSAHDMFIVQIRQMILPFRGGGLLATAGAGAWHWDTSHPAEFGFPAFASRGTTRAFVVGGGVERQMGRHLALDAEARVVFTTDGSSPDQSGVRPFMQSLKKFRILAGLTIPVGPYPSLPPVQRQARWTPPAAGQATVAMSTGGSVADLRPGARVWVTMGDGREFRGVATSPTSIDLGVSDANTPLPFADVRKIEGERIAHGARNGAIIGLLGAGIPVVYYAQALQHGEGGNYPSGLVVGFTALGAGVGALIGAIIDSHHPRRHVLYDSTKKRETVRLVPIVSGRGAGVGGVVHW